MNKVPQGCRLTIVSDSCHSGGLIDKAKEQIGESTKSPDQDGSESGFGFRSFLKQTVHEAFESRGIHLPHEGHRRRHEDAHDAEREYRERGGQGYFKNRSLPLSTLIELLKQKTGKEDIDVGKIRPTLFEVFGEDASPKVKKFMKFILHKLHRHGEGGDGGEGGSLMSIVGGLAHEFLMQKLDDEEEEEEEVRPEEVYASAGRKGREDNGILISGCQSDQTSADANPAGGQGGAYGALSNAIQTILREADGEVSNRKVVLRARKMLEKQGFTQRPGLYCSDDHVDAAFICEA